MIIAKYFIRKRNNGNNLLIEHKSHNQDRRENSTPCSAINKLVSSSAIG